jgi:alpha-aminoadipate/glutamate carrier protein LysW
MGESRGGVKMNKSCLDCGLELEIPEDAISGEVVSCKDCGASFELKNGKLIVAEIAGEDWGQ